MSLREIKILWTLKLRTEGHLVREVALTVLMSLNTFGQWRRRDRHRIITNAFSENFFRRQVLCSNVDVSAFRRPCVNGRQYRGDIHKYHSVPKEEDSLTRHAIAFGCLRNEFMKWWDKQITKLNECCLSQLLIFLYALAALNGIHEL